MQNSSRVFTTTEIGRFLNTAQDIRVEEMADLIEVNEKMRRALSGLILTETQAPISVPPGVVSISDNSVLVPLDYFTSPILRIIEEQAITSDGRITIKPVTHDQYLANIENPFKQPYGKLVWRIDIDRYLELIPNSDTTVTAYETRYIRKPILIDFKNATAELDFPDYILNGIVDLAVNMAVTSLNVGRQEGA